MDRLEGGSGEDSVELRRKADELKVKLKEKFHAGASLAELEEKRRKILSDISALTEVNEKVRSIVGAEAQKCGECKELAKKISEEIEHPQKQIGHDLFLELVQTCPQFITTWLNERPEFIEFCTK